MQSIAQFLAHHFLLITALILITIGLRQYGIGPTYALSDPETRRSLIQAARVRRTWPRLARQLGLSLDEPEHKSAGRSTVAFFSKTVSSKNGTVTTVPRIRLSADQYGIRARVLTIPGVGLEQLQDKADHLSDAWRAVRVTVDRPEPGIVNIRAVRRDPLVEPLPYVHDPEPKPECLRNLSIGIDEYGLPVGMRLEGVAGIVINGLPGYGKTSLLYGIITALAVFGVVQFVVLDGKNAGDYDDLEDRILITVGDDLGQANQLLARLDQFRRDRAACIRAKLGTKNMWSVGPSEDWPLLVVIIDEAHTYFSQVKDGGDKVLKQRNALAAQNALYVEELVKKGRSVGILTILATQKGTGDAIPTFIRDVCAISISFAVRTEEAAIAALGADIKNWPQAHPMQLQDPAYIGVASMQVTGRPGFTRLRTPLVSDDLAATVCRDTAALALRGASSDIGRAQLVGSGAPVIES